MKKTFIAICFVALTAAFLSWQNSAYAAEPLLSDYTNHPIFTVNPVTPNIMIIMDNSGSMNFNAYGSYPGDGGVVTDVPYAGIPYKPTIETRVSTSWDDAEEQSNGGMLDNSDLDMGNFNNGLNDNATSRVIDGLRFQNLSIPVGSQITGAYIEFTAYSTDPGTGAVTLNISGQDIDDAPTFNSTNANISSRTKTSASVSWSPANWVANDTYQTDDIKTIIQEIVDRDNWKAGNDIALIVEHGSQNRYRRAVPYNFASGSAPLLHIEYTQATDTTYYGYFNSSWFYTYGSNKFSLAYKKVSYDTANIRWNVTNTSGVSSTMTDAQIVTAGLYDGNFMNWVCMRRVDVARKVLMGGLATSRTGGGNQINKGEIPAQSSRTYIRHFNSNDGAVPNNEESAVSPYDVDSDYGVKGGYLYIDTNNADGDSKPWTGTYDIRLKIAVQKNITFEPDDFVDGNLAGVLQTIGDQAYWGNAFFNSSGTGNNKEGGSIANSIGTNITNLTTTIENKGDDTWTPLAETYYIVSQYFKQESPESGLGYPNNATGAFNNTMDPYYQNGDFISCAKSFVIYLTDGASTKDSKIPAALKDFDGDGDNTSCNESSNTNCDYSSGGTDYLDDVALYARTTDLRGDLDGDQNLILYPIYAFGNDANARNLLIDAAKNGGFTEKDGIFGPSATNEWDEDSDGLPDTYFEATDGNVLKVKLLEAIYDILARASSGTAVSVLATSSEGEGNLVQAYFKPSVTTGLVETKWVGFLQSLWVDSKGFLREDTNSNLTLDLDADKVISYFTDINGDTKVNKFDVSAADPYPDVVNDTPTVTELDQILPLWEAGDVMSRSLPAQRQIYTYTSGSDWVDFNDDTSPKVDVIKPYLGVKDATAWGYLGTTHDARASNLIHYIRGNDTGFSGTTTTRIRTLNGLTWPLGDIVNSTPVSVSLPPENFGTIYSDESYQQYYNYHKGRTDRENMVYVGANDGMLHAFTSWQYDSTTKSFANPDLAGNPAEEIGSEVWAYIPRALLPHLKWLPRQDYTHVFYVDLKPKITDAKIFYNTLGDSTSGTIDTTTHKNGWGTILIGGLRLGGKSISVTDDFDYDGTTADTTKTFTSSYFAIDISDPRNPQFLWEKTYTDLELTTNQPIIVKVNDKWFAAFGSGPSDYDGGSTKKAHFFIVDLATGTPYKSTNGDDWIFEADDNDGFFGEAASLDNKLNYNVDAIYAGESHQKPSGAWEGALYKIATKFECTAGTCDIADVSEMGVDYGDSLQGVYYDDPNGDSFAGLYEADASNNPWIFYKLYASPSPITAPPALSVDALDNAWVYFGTGRYFSNADKSNSDNQYLYGIKDPFFNREHIVGGTFTPDDSWHNYTNASALTLDSTDLFDADSYKIVFPWGCTEAPLGDCSAVPTGQVGDIYADGSCICSNDSWYRCTEVTAGSCTAAGVDQANEEVWDDGDCVCRVLNPTWGCEETVSGSGACDGIGEGRLGDVNGDGSCTCYYWEAVGSTVASCDGVSFGTVGTGLGDGTCDATKPTPTGYSCSERAVGDCSTVTTGELGDIYNDGGSCECGYFNCTEGIAGGCDDLDYLALPATLTFPDVQGDGSCLCSYVDDPNAVVVTSTGVGALSFTDLISASRLKDGWVRSLTIPKERNLTKPAILGGLSLFTTYVPNSASCSFGGTSYLYALYFETGTANQKPVFDDATVVIDGVTIIRDRLTLGLGMASGVGLHVGQESGGKAKAFIQQSTGVIQDINLDPAFNIRSGLTSWQEQ